MLIYCKTRRKWNNPQPLFLTWAFLLRPRLSFHLHSSRSGSSHPSPSRRHFFHFPFSSQRDQSWLCQIHFISRLRLPSGKSIYSISVSLSLLSLQEVGSIIGKKGEIVKRFREEVSYCSLRLGALKWLKILRSSLGAERSFVVGWAQIII